MISLSPDQQSAVDKIALFIRNQTEQSFTLGGLAGTGKTTIIRKAIEGANSVICATPTGKAASVLSGKLEDLGIECGTLHSLLYKPIGITEADVVLCEQEIERLRDLNLDTRKAERRLRRMVKKLEQGACEFMIKPDQEQQPLVIVDEASMVDEKMERDLRAIAAKILFVGDHGQLPPVNGQPFFDRNTPDAVLSKIHRQDGDSAILRFAHAIRNGKTFTDWNDTDCVRFDVSDHAARAALETADQVITGKNVARRRLNQTLRATHGFTGDHPNAGERVICLRNDHGKGLINGVQGVAVKGVEIDQHGDLRMDLQYEDRMFTALKIDPLAFEQYDRPSLNRRDMPTAAGANEFDYGHAITVHKSQGSEWDNVVVYDDKMRIQDRETRKRWMYTAATRAAKKLTWVDAA
jgi:exodeoxyribonuclease-5